MSNELSHHGIKGQKWGIRRFQNNDGTLTSAGKERYSKEQYKRDVSVYGRAGAKRIQKHVERDGETVSGARSIEARRINMARRRALVGGQIGSTVGTIGGGIGGFVAGKYVSAILSKKGNILFDDPQVQLMTSATVSAGVSEVGKTLGRDGGRAIGMIVSGYSPDRYQHG